MGLLTALLIGFLSLAALNAGFCNGGCIERERQALLKLKQDLVDPAGRLASWTADDEDCCRWKGVVCDNVTSHVLELCLRTPTLDFFTAPIDLFEANERSKLGGKISPSLLTLKHLHILDLSNNDFGGIYIPKFVGSLRSLRVLNLSDSGFGGEVPHHLGNLSSLEYLGLSSVSFSKASNWVYFVNTLPSSLVELRLSFCDLGPYYQVHPITGVNISSLVVLDLSSNFISDLSMVKWVFGLKKLNFLDLSRNQLEGPIPHDLQNLTLLRHLDLSSNGFNSSTANWLDNLGSLEFLDLSGNNFRGDISIRSIRKLCNLSFLSFSSNGYLSLKISHVLGIFSAGCVSNSLERLFLDSCGFSGQLTNQLGNFKILRELQVSNNAISGPIPTSIGELQCLELLDLSSNTLSGNLPESFGHLKTLREMYLPLNSISGPIPTSIGELQSLKFLDLSSNTLSGSLPKSFGQLVNLEEVNIFDNSFDGSLPESFGQLVNLKHVDMSHNSFKGCLPRSFGQLVNMESVDMSYNSFEGTVSEIHFVKLEKLRYFVAHGNSLILEVDSNWVPRFQLWELTLGSWHLGPQFPQWLLSQKYLSYLDISDSKIVDTVPNWFWELSSQCGHVNISNNQLLGHLPNMLNSSSPTSPFDVVTFDFSSNNFIGPLSHISSNLAFLDLSNNKLSGSLFHFLCHERNESMDMEFLNLGQNFLSGELPDCWTKWPNLIAIVLSDNRLIGGIPRSIGTLSHLLSLHLQKNYLSGELPLSLSNCTRLEVLQLSENELEGSIPPWMGHSLSSLIILILGSNEFSGHIPNELCSLNSLQILDLAHNNLLGTLPRCIGNISVLQSTKHYFDGFVIYSSNVRGSKFDSGIPYLENAFVLIKGQLLKYQKTLHLVKIMDFSENSLSGEIPSEITRLQGLLSLNLSHNLFTGRIPENIGNMTMLESADFSWNKLSGSIPESMSSMTFLSHLNLSNNQLTGRIPLGTQLQSFNASSYAGNKLCGLPLPDNCSVNGNSVPSIRNRGGEHGNRVEINWLFVSMALGFIVGFWSVLSPLLISRRWRRMYYQFLEEMWWKISDSVNKYF